MYPGLQLIELCKISIKLCVLSLRALVLHLWLVAFPGHVLYTVSLRYFDSLDMSYATTLFLNTVGHHLVSWHVVNRKEKEFTFKQTFY